MRHIVRILVVVAGASFASMPLVHAAEPSDSAVDSQGHVRQHQDAVPPSATQNRNSRGDQTTSGQSAQAPQSPAVITPPATGDKSVITPPATGESKTPVITPPGTSPNNKDEIQPK
jgi:hypothetical protein